MAFVLSMLGPFTSGFAQSPSLDSALKALQGPSATTELSMAGEWSGKYVCRQGLTGARLVLSADGSHALLHFYAIAENPGVPDGCFTMAGFFNSGTGNLNLTAERWIVRPRNYVYANVSGKLDASGNQFVGRLIGPPGCSDIFLSREQSTRPLPDACARAVP